MGRSSLGGSSLKEGSLRMARMVAACTAQRWREARASLGVVGDEGSGRVTIGELDGLTVTVGGWRCAMRSS